MGQHRPVDGSAGMGDGQAGFRHNTAAQFTESREDILMSTLNNY